MSAHIHVHHVASANPTLRAIFKPDYVFVSSTRPDCEDYPLVSLNRDQPIEFVAEPAMKNPADPRKAVFAVTALNKIRIVSVMPETRAAAVVFLLNAALQQPLRAMSPHRQPTPGTSDEPAQDRGL